MVTVGDTGKETSESSEASYHLKNKPEPSLEQPIAVNEVELFKHIRSEERRVGKECW